MKNILSILLLFLSFTACKDPKAVTDVLNRAEAVMNEHPDSALNLLRTLTFDDFQKESNRARYALLHSQALDKNYIDVTNDSLISVALDYYKDENEVRNKFLSYYYMGRVHANGKDYLDATTCYMEAELLADEVADDYLAGLLYAEMGRIYRLYYDYPKSLEAHQKAAEYYERAGKIRHRNYMWYNKSCIYRNVNEYEQSERMLRLALDAGRIEDDKSLIILCLGDLVMMYVEKGQVSIAAEFYQELLLLVGEDYGSAYFMGQIAKIHLSEKDYSRARQSLEKGWNRTKNRIDSVGLYFSSSELLNALGQEKAAYQELMKGVALQNDEAHQALQQPVLTAQRDYLSEKLKFEAYRIQMERLIRILCILFFSILLLVVAFVLCRKLKKKKKVINELEQKKKQAELRISSLLQQLDNDKEKAEKTIKSLKDEIAQIEKGSNEAIKLAALVQKLENDSKRNSEIVTYLREELKSREAEYRQYFDRLVETFRTSMATMGEIMLDFEEIKAPNTFVESVIKQWKKNYFVGSKALKNLEKLVNEYHDDVMSHFRNQEDYQLVCYLFAGVTIKVIAWLLSKSETGVYQWRIRLRDKIELSDIKHKDLFLKLLYK